MPRKKSVTGSVRGFTLIELLTVLAILVMAAALFPLALNHALPSRRVSAAVDHLVAALRDAQAESAVSGEPVTLQLPDGAPGASGTEPHAILRPIRFPSSVHVELKDASGQRTASLTVFPDGSAQGGEYVVAAAERQSVVEVSGLTGRIAVRRER